jgi:hypothetical protein
MTFVKLVLNNQNNWKNGKSKMKKILLISAISVLFITSAFAQGGGGPMITDDPGTVDKGFLELEVIFESQSTKNEDEFQAPLIDLDYGLANNLDVSFEFPYLIQKYTSQTRDRIGFIELGLKYRFYENNNQSFFLGVVPEVLMPLHKDIESEYLLEFLAEKGFDSFVLSASLGYTQLEESQGAFGSSILAGFNIANGFAFNGEFAFEADRDDLSVNEGVINFGISFMINEWLGFNSSIGTGLFASETESRKKVISFVGLKTTF